LHKGTNTNRANSSLSNGGIPTNCYAQVVLGSMDKEETPVPGFFAAGEIASALFTVLTGLVLIRS